MRTLSPHTGFPVFLKTLLDTLATDVVPSENSTVAPRLPDEAILASLMLLEIFHLCICKTLYELLSMFRIINTEWHNNHL